MIPTFTGKVDRGKVLLDRPSQYLIQISRLEGQRIEIILRKLWKKRSDNQNRFYWGVVLEILGEHCGYDAEEMHEALKEKFLSNQRDEKGLVKIRSTAKLNTAEFEEYLDKIKKWSAMELNCFIPDPNEVAT